MHCIIVKHNKTIEGIVLKNRTFQKLALILTGDSFGITVIQAFKLEHEVALGWDVNTEENRHKLIVPDKEVILYFELPIDYAKAHGKPKLDTGTPSSCAELGSSPSDPIRIACDRTNCPDNKLNECQRQHIIVLDEEGRCKAPGRPGP
jgi:hypothetical protein